MNSKSVIFTAPGEPRDVLKVIENQVEATNEFPILIRMLYCPINPADGLRIRGKFGF
jgi:NADPH:quinone reductase-like Zn-dependent oxidoreductase